MITLNISTFRTSFPAYSNETTYPDATVTMNWDASVLYIDPNDYGWLDLAQRERAIYLMTAHIFYLSDMIAKGQTPAITSASSIDKISVTTTPPPVKNQFHYWLATTPYGAQLLALLKLAGIGGMYVGGRAERSAFRKAGGVF